MLATKGIIQSNSRGLLLDIYTGSAVAYSLRKLRNGYNGSAIRVRRSSDNTEQDIGFASSGGLDESSLTTFVGANSGYVTKWYDQSGNGRDASQTTSANQPRLVNAGTINKKNNKPCIEFDGSNYRMSTSSFSWGTSLTFASVFDPSKNGSNYTKLWTAGIDSVSSGYAFITYTGATQIDWQVNDNALFGKGYQNVSYPRIVSSSQFTENAQILYFANLNSTSSNAYINGVELTYRRQFSGNSDNGSYNLYLGSADGSFSYQYYKGNIQELIIYTIDKSSNRTGIKSNINSYYSIY